MTIEPMPVEDGAPFYNWQSAAMSAGCDPDADAGPHWTYTIWAEADAAVRAARQNPELAKA